MEMKDGVLSNHDVTLRTVGTPTHSLCIDTGAQVYTHHTHTHVYTFTLV